MAWKIIGYMEGRAGQITMLPESAIGEPNLFTQGPAATQGARAMQEALGGDKSPVRYLAVPCLDSRLHGALSGNGTSLAPAPAPAPSPAVSFSGSSTPAPA